MEACWLAVAVTIPLFFNISSAQTFERDKMLVLKFLTVLSCAAWLLKWIDGLQSKPDNSREAAGKRFRLNSPLVVLPVLVLAAVYTLSSIASLVPGQSWLGSYDRSQGTLAFYCYAILFLVVLSELRTPSQLSRLQYALILASLPVAAYAMLQQFGSDPFRWNAIRGRASGSMGNPIFMGAYLVMAIPLTVSRLADAIKMLRADGDRRSGLALACSCGIILMLQVSALLCTQSRGPVMALAVASYLCIFVFLILKRTSCKDRLVFPVAAAGLGLAAPILLILNAGIISKLPASIWISCLAAAVVFMAAVFMVVWHTAWGRSWLWLTWLIQMVALVLVFAAGSDFLIRESSKASSSLGRLARLSDKSVNVRRFLWKTGFDAIRSGAPASLPGGKRDAFHFLRPAIGYGPECIFFAANLYAIPDLVQRHTSETVDRMHNETFDDLISIGFAGAVLHLFIFSSAIFYSLRCLGLLGERHLKILFAVFLLSGSGAGVLLPWLAGSPHMAGIGVQAGLLAGLTAFVAWCGFQRLPANFVENPRQIFMLCVMGALTAHFVETATGIAVTSTQTFFSLLLAVLCILASGNIEEEPAKHRASRPRPWFQSPLLPLTVIASLVVLVEAWCFVINTTTQQSALALFLKTWFYQSEGLRIGLSLPGALILMGLTICGGIGLMYGEKPGFRAQNDDFWKMARISLGCMVFVWLVMGIFAAKLWAALDPSVSSPINTSLHAEARITLFLVGLLLILATASWSLVAADSRRYSTASTVRPKSLWFGLLLAVGASVIVFQQCVRPAWADIACRIGRIYEAAGDPASASKLYKRAADLAPYVVPYQISLGFAQSKAGASDANQMRESVQSLQRALDLNPLNPASHRSLGALHVQMGEQARDPAIRDAELHTAAASFQQAIRLSPSYPESYNDLGRCCFLLGDHERAEKLYQKSLRMYPDYAETHMYIGEMQYRLNNLERALQSFSEAARLDRKNVEARKNQGFLLALLGHPQEAISADLAALRMAPQDTLLLRRLSSLYFGIGDYNAGLAYARRAYDATPNTERGSFDTFIEALKQQASPSVP